MLKVGQQGVSLIEALIAAVILGMLVWASLLTFNHFSKASNRSRAITQSQRVILTLINRIKDAPSLFQNSLLTAGTSSAITEFNRIKKDLPFAFNDPSNIQSASDCPSCPGRLGVLIQSAPGVPSINIVTLFIKDPRHLPADETKTIQFIASPTK